MVQIGLHNNLVGFLTSRLELSTIVAQSREHRALDTLDDSFLVHLKHIGKSNDIDTLLNSEKIILEFDLSNRANSLEETNSIKTALVQLADAQRAYKVVQDVNIYKEGTEAFSTRQREAGLPMDAFREFIKSHTTRLTNRLSAPLPASEKNLLRQRKENLKVAKEPYIVLQRKALGMK